MTGFHHLKDSVWVAIDASTYEYSKSWDCANDLRHNLPNGVPLVLGGTWRRAQAM